MHVAPIEAIETLVCLCSLRVFAKIQAADEGYPYPCLPCVTGSLGMEFMDINDIVYRV